MAEALTAAGTAFSEKKGSRRIGYGIAALVLLAVAALLRWDVFGNPVVHVDEEFYLLAGGRMLHGALPYVDIWDRKPIGLFLIYAFAHLLGGDGVIQYQIMALLSVTATATILFALARRVSNDGGALAAAALYTIYLTVPGGEGGQSPIFYNLPVAGAVAILFFARLRPETQGGNLRWPGVASMLLFGIAMQIKYTALFEGLFVGILLLGMAWRRGRPLPALAVDAALWIGCAVMPTLLAGGAYAAMGHLHEWLFANIFSITQRSEGPHAGVPKRIREMAGMVVPLVLAILLRRWTGARPESEAERENLRFLDAWAASALLGVVLFGTWFDHYALPLFAPFAVTAAPLGRSRWGRIYLGVGMVLAAATGQALIQKHQISRGNAELLAEATAATGDHAGKGCIFVYEGMTALYDTTRSCIPTTHPFPAHLFARNELGATGIDEATEVRRIMATRPDRVMTIEPITRDENPAARDAVEAALKRDYRPIWQHPGGTRTFFVYALNR